MQRLMTDFRLRPARCSASCATALCLALTGCSVGPKYHPPVTQAPPSYKESPTQFKEAEGWKVAQPSDAMLRGKWWEIFKDPELNALEDQLNINNQNIKLFFENFMQARALVREARAQYFPTVAAVPSYSRSLSSSNLGSSHTVTGGITGIASNSGQRSTFVSLPLDVSWQPDLWGKIRNTVHENQYAAQLSAADLENERLTEQASLAEFFFEIRGQDALQKIWNDTVEADKKSLELTRALYETGIDNQISVVEAETALQSAQASATNVGLARAQFEHAIAMLIGKTASEFSIPVRPMTTAPPPIPVGLPSQLLERRPDIAAAERNMAAANALIGIAYAAYYPTVTLSPTGGVESSTLTRLLNWPSRFWSIGGSFSETIFDAGLRRATVNQFIATYNADLASYRQTVLTAFQQVEDFLSAVRILSQQIKQQAQAVGSAQIYLTLEMGRYETGIDPYLNVVIAQTTLLSNQLSLVTAQVSEMTAAVQLITALGGGWDRSQLPTPAQVTQKPTKAETAIGR
ncbi:MAG: Heavy metal efflux outer membrane protein CzcC family [Bryobacterales bacterium]|nr:Heavy metal efflux outer membrane protein CzcC family [Bryobacterales bacterium]